MTNGQNKTGNTKKKEREPNSQNKSELIVRQAPNIHI